MKPQTTVKTRRLQPLAGGWMPGLRHKSRHKLHQSFFPAPSFKVHILSRPEVLASVKPGGRFPDGSRLPGARIEILDPGPR